MEHFIEEGQLETWSWILKKVKDKQNQEGKQTQTIQKNLTEMESREQGSITS